MNDMRKISAVGFAAVLLAAAASAAPTPRPDPAKLSEHIKVLASDAFEGRGPGTRAETKTLDYIVS